VRFSATPLAGCAIVDTDAHQDNRGQFARLWCQHEFEAAGIESSVVQMSVSTNAKRGTVRGMHMQTLPSQEGKFVRCIRGSIFDVAVDMRPRSPTFMRWFGIHLDSRSRRALFIPSQFAHGFQTLEDDCEVLYQMTDFYQPALQFGFRWDDPAFGIDWPIASGVTLSPKDEAYPNFSAASFAGTRMQEPVTPT